MSRYASVHADAHDVDRHLDARLEEAQGVLGLYVDPPSLRPFHAVALEPLIERKAKVSGLSLDAAEARVQQLLKERCTSERTGISVKTQVAKSTGREFTAPALVYLDEDHLYSRSFGLPDVPAIAFGDLITTDSMYEAGKVEAIACFFDPTLTELTHSVYRGVPEVRSDEWDPRGYIAICRTFPSHSDAVTAMRELRHAIRTIQTPPTDSAIEVDTFQDNSWMEDEDCEEAL